MRALYTTLAWVAGLLAAPFAHAQGSPVVTRIVGTGIDSYDLFGNHAAIDSGVVVVSAPRHVTDIGTERRYGGTYVFRDVGGRWTEEAILTAPNMSVTGPGIGSSVAYVQQDGTEWVAAGSRGNGPNVPGQFNYGAVFVWQHTGTGPLGGWEPAVRLQQADVRENDQTGAGVALVPLGDGGLALAAASRTDMLVFERDTAGAWTETARLPVGVLARFSEPNVLSGSTSDHGALVAMPGSGGARVFRRDPATAAWAQEATLAPAAPGPDEVFTTSTAVLGAGTARGGAPLADDLVLMARQPGGNEVAGSAYVFRYDAEADGGAGRWVEEAALRPAVGVERYGDSVVLDVDAAGRAVAVVGGGRQYQHVFLREAPGVWREVLAFHQEAAGVVASQYGVWGGRVVAGNGAFGASQTRHGAAWVLDLRPVYATDVAETPAAAGSLALSAPRPNPARGVVRLSVTGAEAAVTVRVSDVLGREVARAEGGEVVLDVRSWAPGVYVVRAEAGGAVAARRITVAR